MHVEGLCRQVTFSDFFSISVVFRLISWGDFLARNELCSLPYVFQQRTEVCRWTLAVKFEFLRIAIENHSFTLLYDDTLLVWFLLSILLIHSI